MKKLPDTAHIDSILDPWKAIIGQDYEGYRNHVVRMATFCQMLQPCGSQEQRKIEIAACFHDIGIWAENTLDYLGPSLLPARRHLEENGLTGWDREVSEMILEHHKLREVKNGITPLVEVFRKGDLVDFSKGMVRFGLPESTVNEVMQKFPNAGFHLMLLKRAAKWLRKHPLTPLPMMKW